MDENKLKAWEKAGLIDPVTANRINTWEAAHRRPLALWAIMGIAALAIGLGLISIVAANWDAMPGSLRLVIHFALIAGLAAFLYFGQIQLAGERPWLHEAALFLFGILGLGFLGHLGQVYQTSSPLWPPLLAWLLLFAPLLLVQGHSWLTAAALMLAMVIAAWSAALSLQDDYTRLTDGTILPRSATLVSLPILAAGVAAWMRDFSNWDTFWRRLRQLALDYAIGGASLIVTISAFQRWPDNQSAGAILGALYIVALFGLTTAAIIRFAQRSLADRANAFILVLTAMATVASYIVSGSHLMAGILFLMLWAGIAAANLHANRPGLFRFAVGVIAIRLILLSFELGENLLTSGSGLVASGLLSLGISWGALQISSYFAPGRPRAEARA